MNYFYFSFDGISSKNYNLVVQNKGEDLNYPSQPNFENQIVSPLYQNTSYLAGVNKKERVFTFNCWADSLTLEKTRSLISWLSVDKIGDLVLDYNPNFHYRVKIQSISDFNHLPVNEDGTGNYGFTLSFITIEDFAAISNQNVTFDTTNYTSQVPIGTNLDNGGPITFNDLNLQTFLPEFKILNYYSEPVNLNLMINTIPNGVPDLFGGTSDGKFSIKLNGTEYYNYSNNGITELNYFLDTQTGIATINTSTDLYHPKFELAESFSYIAKNENLGRMDIPPGDSKTLITSVLSKDSNFPYPIQFLDVNNSLPYDFYDIATGNLYVIVQDGSYGDNSTTSYDPINEQNYIYNKINKDGTNSDISLLQFNTDAPQSVSTSGQLAWNNREGTLDLSLSNDFVLQIGEELFYYVKCATALQGNPFGPISKGDPVMFAGFDEQQNILVVKASYAVLAEYPFFYLGIASEDVPEGASGYVTLFGRLSGLHFTYPAGTVLYIDPMIPGTLTDVKPAAPLRNIIIGAAILPDIGGAGVGQIIVSTTQSQGVLNLYDVVTPEGHPLTGDTLVYQESPIPGYQGTWITAPSVNAAGGIAVQDQAEVFTGTNVETVLKELYDTKVTKITGYSLMLDTDKNKLDGIASGAEVNVQSDWTETNISSDSYIKNKPSPYSLPTASTTVLGGVKIDGTTIAINNGVISSLTSGGTVTSVTGNYPISVENSEQDPVISILEVTTELPGSMSSSDKVKLDSIEENAQVNVNANWNETDQYSDSYILNKPTIPTQYTDENALDAVGNSLYDTTSIDLVYEENLIKAFAKFGTTEGSIAQGNDYRFTDSREPKPHTHGNISSLGQIGGEANLAVITGVNGVLTTTSRLGLDSRTEFPPSSHIHQISDIEDLQSNLDSKALIPTNQSEAISGYVLTSNGDGTSTYQESSAFYNLPAATTTTLGGIKVGDNLTINNGVLSWTPAASNVLAELLGVSTGVYQFNGITQIDDTHFSVGAAKGFIIDNTTNPDDPTITYVQYTGSSSILAENIGVSYQTQIFLKSDSTLLFDTTDLPSCPQRRDSIYLGRIVHPSTIITAVENVPDLVQSPVSQLRDLWKGLGVINDKNYIYSNNTPSTNLSLALHGGTLYYNGINFVTNPKRPSRKDISSQSLLTFNYRLQNGSGTNGITVLDPTKYDNNGTLTTVPNPGSTATNQRVYLSPTGLVLIQYGQTIYNNLEEAIAAVSSESFTVASAIAANAVLIGVISITKDATNLTSTYAKFHTISKFGEISGGAGGGGTTGPTDAIDISFNPSGSISSTNVQAAITELDTDVVNTLSDYITPLQSSIISSDSYYASTVSSENMPSYQIGDMIIAITDIYNADAEGWDLFKSYANNGSFISINYKIATTLTEDGGSWSNIWSQTVKNIIILVLRNVNTLISPQSYYHYADKVTYPSNTLRLNDILFFVGNGRNATNSFVFTSNYGPSGSTFLETYSNSEFGDNVTGLFYQTNILSFDRETIDINDLDMGFGISFVAGYFGTASKETINTIDAKITKKASLEDYNNFNGETYFSAPVTFGDNYVYVQNNKVWHAGNDGSDSGLDADLLDGQHGSYYAPLSSPTFTGTVTLPSTTSIGNISATELGYMDGVTSAIQTQLNAKEATITTGTTSQYWRGDKTWQTISTTDINVNITNDTTTNATYYPTFVTSTSGAQEAKVSSTKLTFNPSTGTLTATSVVGAVFNDYAEFRQSLYDIKAGYVVCEDIAKDDYVILNNKRRNTTAMIVSDTFGFSIGKQKKNNEFSLPIAVSGRVLVYTNEDTKTFNPGDAVCASKNGKISKMKWWEKILFPDAIIGIVSSIPTYKIWGTNNIDVDNRIWIKIK